jgi:hypothetical protein
MEMLLSLLSMGWRVKACHNGKFYLQAGHNEHADIFAKEEHLTTAIDKLHAQAIKKEYPHAAANGLGSEE